MHEIWRRGAQSSPAVSPELAWKQEWNWLPRLRKRFQSAHEAGILHRDIKPANLLVGAANDLAEKSSGHSGQNTRPHVLIADFGIGQIITDELLRGGARLGFTLTVTDLRRSTLSGTMLYLAPEVLEGNVATARSDVYSLGVILWQLLIGNLSAALDVVDWPARIQDPLLLEDLHRSLAGLPEKRWLCAGDFAASLRALPARRATEARRQAELASRERAAYRRGVMRTAFVALAAVTAIAALARYAWDKSIEAEEQRKAAAAERTQATSVNCEDSRSRCAPARPEAGFLVRWRAWNSRRCRPKKRDFREAAISILAQSSLS